MKQLKQKIACVALLGAMVVSPHAVNAAVDTPVPGYEEQSMRAENLTPPTDFVNALTPADEREARYVTVRVITAYSSTPDQCDSTPFITANGTYVHDGVIAANWLKFGDRVRIPEYFGDKVFIVADRMNPRFDDRMDIWMPDRASAVNFGLRKLMVEVL